MALKECKCPLGVLPDLPNDDCDIKFGQLFGMGVQKPQDTPYFTDIPGIQTLANWETALAAEDDTKIQVFNFSKGLEIPNSEAEYEDDDKNYKGISIYQGEQFVRVIGEMQGITTDMYKGLQEFSCFSLANYGLTSLTAFFFNTSSQIIHDSDDANSVPDGIPIYNFRISSVGNDGTKNASNIYQIGFDLLPYWDKNVIKTDSPNFNPLELENA